MNAQRCPLAYPAAVLHEHFGWRSNAQLLAEPGAHIVGHAADGIAHHLHPAGDAVDKSVHQVAASGKEPVFERYQRLPQRSRARRSSGPPCRRGARQLFPNGNQPALDAVPVAVNHHRSGGQQAQGAAPRRQHQHPAQHQQRTANEAKDHRHEAEHPAHQCGHARQKAHGRPGRRSCGAHTAQAQGQAGKHKAHQHGFARQDGHWHQQQAHGSQQGRQGYGRAQGPFHKGGVLLHPLGELLQQGVHGFHQLREHRGQLFAHGGLEVEDPVLQHHVLGRQRCIARSGFAGHGPIGALAVGQLALACQFLGFVHQLGQGVAVFHAHQLHHHADTLVLG